MRVITKPNGRPVTLGEYVRCWKILQTIPPGAMVPNWDHFPTEAREVLRDIEDAVHARINTHLPWYGRGRKWEWVWQADTLRAARALNTPRLAIHWLPYWLKPRFQHRLSGWHDEYET